MSAINPFPLTSSNVKLVETTKKLEQRYVFHCIFLSELVFDASIFFILDLDYRTLDSKTGTTNLDPELFCACRGERLRGTFPNP